MRQFGLLNKMVKRFIPGVPSKKSKESFVPSKIPKVTSDLTNPQFCLALTTWVIHPELGISDFQSLIKASAFVVKANATSSTNPQYHIVTTNHNVAPWLFPKYYPEPFMEYINESHTYYTVELRSSTGEIFTQYDLKPIIYHHPDRDLAVLHLQSEETSLSFLKDLNFRVLDTESYLPADDEELIFHGHEVFDGDINKAFEGEQDPSQPNLTLSAPRTMKGSLAGRTKHQTFCKTEKIMSPGMCGGVAVSKRGSICGMIEGIVPKDHPHDILRNLGVIIDAPDILSFLGKVEEIQRDPENVPATNDVSLLVGGESIELLRENTSASDLDKYVDPLKVLHNTLYPEDMKFEAPSDPPRNKKDPQ